MCFAGEPCPCGTWMTPAFHIQKNKVDECRSGVLTMRARQTDNSSPLTQTAGPSPPVHT